MSDSYFFTLSCTNRPGIVASVASCIFTFGGNILEAQQFDDVSSNRFYMRVVFESKGPASAEECRQRLATVAETFKMSWQLRPKTYNLRALLLVSKYDHCLHDLLYRTRIGELPMDIVGIVSNHPIDSTAFNQISCHYLPVTANTKADQENKIKQLVEDTRADLIVLARYMQILSNDLCNYLHGRCINIHHSFLPGFKGAKPYIQAFERGVKMIGATAHYVTADLDEGPIIAQDVEQVSHTDSADTLARRGRDIERRVLARAVHYHLEERVLINGHRTVVFRD